MEERGGPTWMPAAPGAHREIVPWVQAFPGWFVRPEDVRQIGHLGPNPNRQLFPDMWVVEVQTMLSGRFLYTIAQPYPSEADALRGARMVAYSCGADLPVDSFLTLADAADDAGVQP